MLARPLVVIVAVAALLGPARLASSSIGAAGAGPTSGGPGADLFSGGPGFDTVDYSSRDCDVTVTVGDGLANDGCPGEGDDVTGAIEHVIGGSGDDRLTGDGSAELLVGGAGADRLVGLGGDDELRGDAGDDVLLAGSNDDYLIGGPGNDQQRGEGNNDTFTPSPQTHFTATPSDPIADRATTVDSIALSGLPSSIQDLNVRIDVAHPATEQLRIVLISPAGNRVGLSRNRGNGTPMRGTTFDSEAVTNIRLAGARPFEGRFHPDDSMETFEGQNPNGTWRLEIVDGTSGGVGTLEMWRLQLTFPTSAHDGNDLLSGGSGVRDIVDWSGRTQPLDVTMGGGADDGQAGEADDVGTATGDIEDSFGGSGDDRITGTGARNDLRGQMGADLISGMAGPDTLRGRQGADTIFGGDGDDSMLGFTGGDRLDGRAGTDRADGGADVDVCISAEVRIGCEG